MSIRERYLTATQSSHLTVDPHHVCDADRLLAAGYAAAGDPLKSLALDVYRLRALSDMRGARHIAERMAHELMHQARQDGRNRRLAKPPSISRVAAVDMCLTVLKWWHMPACPACEGRCYPLIPDTPHLDATRECSACAGSGIRPLKKHIKSGQLDLAYWLVDRLDSLTAIVFADMLKRMPRLSD